MTFGMLPLLECGRCGMRGIPIGFAACPGCSAVYGWAMINRAVFVVLVVAVRLDQINTLRRLAERHVQEVRTARARVLQARTEMPTIRVDPDQLSVHAAAALDAQRIGRTLRPLI